MQNITLRERAAVYAIGLWFATDLGEAGSAALEMMDRVTEIAGVSFWGQTQRRSQT